MSINNSETSAQTAEDSHNEIHFGSALKEERLKQGLSLEEISARTAINLKHLQSIESGDRRQLPADVFNIGFIKIYSSALGLDPTKSLKIYEQEWGFSNGMRGAEIYLGHEYMAQSSSVLADRNVLVFIFIVITVAVTFLLLKVPGLNFTNNNLPVISTPAPNSETDQGQDQHPANLTLSPTNQDNATRIDSMTPDTAVVEEEEEEEMVEPSTAKVSAVDEPEQEEINLQDIYANDETSDNSSTPISDSLNSIEISPSQNSYKFITDKEDPANNSAAKLPDSKGDAAKTQIGRQEYSHILEASFSETTWLTITIDDQPSAEYTFKPNEKYTWRAKENLVIFLGNTGGVNLYLNDEPVEFIKRSGKTFKLVVP